MANKTTQIAALFSGVLFFTACHHQEPVQTGTSIMPLAKNDGGVVVLGAHATPESKVLSDFDCQNGEGVNVSVEGVSDTQKHHLNKNGDPCMLAKTVFDGRSAKGRRAADVGVNISFVDKYGAEASKDALRAAHQAVPPQGPQDDVTLFLGNGEDAVFDAWQAPAASEDAAQNQDPLAGVVQQWRAEGEYNTIVKQAERLLAGYRDLGRMNSNELIVAHQEKIEALEAQLRQQQRDESFQQSELMRLQKEAEEIEKKAVAERLVSDQSERKLRQDIQKFATRAEEYERINQDLVRKRLDKEKNYQRRVARLQKDLIAAEQEVEMSQQGLIEKAAKRIAEAEYLAKQARVARRSSLERKAEGLQQQAELAMREALDTDDGQPMVIKAFDAEAMQQFENQEVSAPSLAGATTPVIDSEAENTADTLLNLEDITVTLREEDMLLEKVFLKAFADMDSRIGNWEVIWALSEGNKGISQEKWTVIAEAPFGEFLAYVSAKVQQEKGVSLKYRRFDNSNLFVISDE